MCRRVGRTTLCWPSGSPATPRAVARGVGGTGRKVSDRKQQRREGSGGEREPAWARLAPYGLMTSVPTSEDVPGEGVETRPGAARFIRATAALGRGTVNSKSSYTRARGTKFLVALVLTVVAAFALSGNALAAGGTCAATGTEVVVTDQ